MSPMHNCPYCNNLVPDDNPYCGKCGGPQTYQPKGSAARLGLDPWVITAAQAKQRFQVDDEAVRALVNTWRNDPDHGRTREIQQDIQEALSRGILARTESYFYCCPWSPIYQVNRDATVGGRRLARGQQFTFDVSAEEIPKGGRFKCEILVGEFHPTDKIDYCLPGENEHHDE